MKKRLFILCSVILLVGAAVLASAGDEAPPTEGQAVFEYDDHGKRDPFLKLVSLSGAIVNYDRDMMASDMILEGIMTGEGGGNIAIINGEIVGTYDMIGMFVIKEITTTTVILQKGGENFTLKLKKED